MHCSLSVRTLLPFGSADLSEQTSGTPTESEGMSGAVVFDDQHQVTVAVVFHERLEGTFGEIILTTLAW